MFDFVIIDRVIFNKILKDENSTSVHVCRYSTISPSNCFVVVRSGVTIHQLLELKKISLHCNTPNLSHNHRKRETTLKP